MHFLEVGVAGNGKNMNFLLDNNVSTVLESTRLALASLMAKLQPSSYFQKGTRMNVSAMALPRYRVPFAKTIGISLLQAIGFAVMLYFAALICAVVSTAFGEPVMTETSRPPFAGRGPSPLLFMHWQSEAKSPLRRLGGPPL